MLAEEDIWELYDEIDDILECIDDQNKADEV